MPKGKAVSSSGTPRKTRPAFTPEGRELQLVSLAMDRAEQQLRDGTASSQVITHFLKLATEREKTEREILKLQKELIVAKTENLQSTKRTEEMFEKAMAAFKDYRGQSDPGDDYDY